jgi:hypothetical protein
MSTQPQLSPLEQLMQQAPAQAQPTTQSDLSPLEQLMAMHPSTPAGGPSQEEQAFLKANPDHQWVPADPKFTNRPEGIYPTGPGNEWRKDPSYAQAPIDLHFAKHTAEGAAEGALVAGSALGAPFVDPVVTAVAAHLGKVKAILDAAGRLGLTGGGIGFGIKEARELYKEFSGDSKK